MIELKLVWVPFSFTLVALAWVHCSRQADIPRDVRTSLLIALRSIALVGLLVYLAHVWLNVSANTILRVSPIALVLVLAASLEHPPGDSLGQLAILMTLLLPFYVAKQLVLGFPDRKKFILEPDLDVAQCDDFQSLVGKTGVVSVALRPMGNVMIDNIQYAAKASSGDFIPSETAIVVIRASAGQVVVDTQEDAEFYAGP